VVPTIEKRDYQKKKREERRDIVGQSSKRGESAKKERSAIRLATQKRAPNTQKKSIEEPVRHRLYRFHG